MGVTRLTELVRAACFAERKDTIDYRREFARVDELRDLSELTTARVAGHNETSIGLHRAAGFELVGVEREVGRKHRQWLDVVELQRLL